MREPVAVRQRHDAAERVAARGEVGDEPERDPDHALAGRSPCAEARGDRDALVDRAAARRRSPTGGRGAEPRGNGSQSRPVHAAGAARRRVGAASASCALGQQRRAGPHAARVRRARRPGRRRRCRCAGAARGRRSPSACAWRALGGLAGALAGALAVVEDPGHEQRGAPRAARARAAPRRPRSAATARAAPTAPRGGVHTPNQAPSTSRRPSRRSSIARTRSSQAALAGLEPRRRARRAAAPRGPGRRRRARWRRTRPASRPSWQRSSVSRRPASPESRRRMISSMRAQAVS